MSDTDQTTAAATARATQFKEATDKVRERSDAAAKTLVGLGTAGLTAVGISKFSDVYPLPDGEVVTVVLVIAAFLCMAGVLVALTFLLLKANRPLVPEVDADTMEDTDDDEKDAIKIIYDAVARENGASAMRVYDARGQRLQRIADRKAQPSEAAPIQAMAARIRAETEAAMARAALLVSRRRMNNALKSGGAIACAIVFTIALLTFGIGADRLDSKRSAEVTAYKACADAVKAGVVASKLPSICDGVTTTPPAEDPAAMRRDALLELYTTCVGTAVKTSSPLTDCDAIKAELQAAAK